VSLKIHEGAYSYGASLPQEESSGMVPEELDVGTVQDDPANLRGLKRPSFTEVAKATPVILSNA
jgi:hypothetical protein